MPTIERGEHVSILGETGSGKTFWARDYLSRERRVLVVDTEEGFDFSPKEWPPVSLKWLEHTDVLKNESRNFHLAFRPRDNIEVEDVEALCALLLKRGQNLIAYFDEVTDYSSANFCGPWLKKMFRKSRKRRITTMASTQRPSGFNHWFSENSQHVVLFYINEYDTTNTPVGRLAADYRDQVPYHSFKYVYVNPAGEISVRGGKK